MGPSKQRAARDVSEFTVSGSDASEVLLAGLGAILQAARAGRSVDPAEEGESIVVPIRGQGTDLGTLFAELARDLLAQFDVHGAGLNDVRLDGLLTTDDGFVGWGYLEGTETDDGAIAAIDLTGDPSVEEVDGGLVLRFRITST